MKAEERTWFPFIMTGITILILGVYVGFGGVLNGEGQNVQDNIEQISAPTNAEYQSAVLEILSRYDVEQNAGQSYEDLLNVTVPAEYRETHLELVVAFGELRAGKIEEGQGRLDLLRQEVNWIP